MSKMGVMRLLQDILANLVSSAISAFIVWCATVVIRSTKSASDATQSEQKYSRKAIKAQFFACLVLLPLSLSVGLLIPAPLVIKTATDVLLTAGRVMCFIIAFCAFMLAWGAFDAAFVFLDQGYDLPQVPPWVIRMLMTEDEIREL